MKKLILKTIFITCAVSVMLIFALFGVLSFWAPSVMMNFTASLGMETVSGDYAFQEYERSGSISCLARSFLIASKYGKDKTAEKRFDLLYADEDLLAFCNEQDGVDLGNEVPDHSYYDFLCGQGACVKYRLAGGEVEKGIACAFAVDKTDESFPAGNPVIALAVYLVKSDDTDGARILLEEVQKKTFSTENGHYKNIVALLGVNS